MLKKTTLVLGALASSGFITSAMASQAVPVNVSEPGMIGLVAVGIAGLVVAARARKK